MPRKIRQQKQEPHRGFSRNEIVLYVITAIVALSMICGTLASALGR